MTDSSRRAFLSSGIAMGSAGMAGCLDAVPGFDSDSTDDTGDERPGLPAFHKWLYAPDAVDADAYTYTYAEGIGDWSSEFPPRNVNWALDTVGRVSYDDRFSEVEYAVSVDYRGEAAANGAVIAGGFDPAEIRSEISDTAEGEDSIEAATHAGYDVFFDDTLAVAIGDGNVPAYLIGTGNEERELTGREIIEVMIDAHEGTATRLHESSDTADLLLRHQGERTVVFGAPEVQGRAESLFEVEADTDTPAIDGGGFTFDSGEAETDADTRVTVVTAESVSDTDAFADALPVLDWFGDPSVTQDGRVLTFEEGGDGDSGRRAAPEATFNVDFSGNTAAITHTSGDAIPADELEVRIERDGNTQTIPWTAVSGGGDVRAGTTATVPIDGTSSGDELRIVWTPESTVLHTDSIPRTTNNSPDATFDIRFDLASDTATIVHVDGDPVPVDEIDLILDGTETRFVTWAELSEKQAAEPGDSVTVDLYESDYGGRLHVLWNVENVAFASEPIPNE